MKYVKINDKHRCNPKKGFVFLLWAHYFSHNRLMKFFTNSILAF
jgi:hypothetical protein